MEAEELQIGDWVKLCNKKGEWLDYSQVDLNLLNREEEGVVIFKPIPITPEILALNGFSLLEQTRTYKVFTLREEDELSIQVDFFGKDSHIIVRIEKYNYESKYYMNCLHNCDIKYLHQLQHAMRLCGIDKEITLN